MAFVQIPGGLWVGAWNASDNTPAISNATAGVLSTADHRVAMVITAPKDGTLHSFELRMGSVTQNPTNGIRFSFQGLDADDNPDNTDDQFAVVATGSIAANSWIVPPNAITSDGTSGGVKRTVTAGEGFACVMKFASFVAGDSVNFSVIDSNECGYAAQRSTNAGSTWTRSLSPLNFVLRYDDGYEYISQGINPVLAVASTAFNDSSVAADEIGNRIIMPFTGKLGWVRPKVGTIILTAQYQLVVYDDVDAVVDSFTFVGGRFVPATTFFNPTLVLNRETLTMGEEYRIVIKPLSSNNITVYEFQVSDNAHLNAVGGGIEYYKTSRVNAGAWADVDTSQLWMQLGFAEIDVSGSGGGGGSYAFIG